MTEQNQRPMFDDDSLPAWLTRAGITHAPHRAAPPPTAVPDPRRASQIAPRLQITVPPWETPQARDLVIEIIPAPMDDVPPPWLRPFKGTLPDFPSAGPLPNWQTEVTASTDADVLGWLAPALDSTPMDSFDADFGAPSAAAEDNPFADLERPRSGFTTALNPNTLGGTDMFAGLDWASESESRTPSGDSKMIKTDQLGELDWQQGETQSPSGQRKVIHTDQLGQLDWQTSGTPELDSTDDLFATGDAPLADFDFGAAESAVPEADFFAGTADDPFAGLDVPADDDPFADVTPVQTGALPPLPTESAPAPTSRGLLGFLETTPETPPESAMDAISDSDLAGMDWLGAADQMTPPADMPDFGATAESTVTDAAFADLGWLDSSAEPTKPPPSSGDVGSDLLAALAGLEAKPTEPTSSPADADWLLTGNLDAAKVPDLSVLDDLPDLGSADSDQPVSDIPDWIKTGFLPDNLPDAPPAQPPTPKSIDKPREPTAPSQPETAQPAMEIPDWLMTGNLDESKLPELPQTSSLMSAALADADKDVPEWLRGSQSSTPMANFAGQTAPTPELDEELPDWLATGVLTDAADVPSTPKSGDKPAAADKSPLADVPRPSKTRRPDTAVDLPVGDLDIDSLLNNATAAIDLAALQSEVAEEQLAVEADTFGDLDLTAAEATAALDAMAELPDLSADLSLDLSADLPPNLAADLGLPDLPSDLSGVASAAPDLTAAAEIPAQASALPPAAPPAEPTKKEAPKGRGRGRGRKDRSTTEVAVAAEELPEWVEVLKPSTGPVIFEIGDQKVAMEDQPIAALPEHLRALREKLGPVISIPVQLEPKGSPLEGINNPLSPVVTAGAPSAAAAIEGGRRTASQARSVSVLQSILAAQDALMQKRGEEDLAQTTFTARKARSRPKIDRFLVTILLIVTVLLPFFTDVASVFEVPRPDTLSATDQARFDTFFSTVEAVQGGRPVLIAFDYAPSATGELDELAKSLLRDVLRRGGRPVIVSTNPSSALHAYGLISDLASDAVFLASLGRTEPFAARRDYWVIGYLSGGIGGVRALSNALYADTFEQQVVFDQDSEGLPTGLAAADIQALRNVPTFLLAGANEDVRAWVEQYQTPPNAPQGESLRMVLMVSAAASTVAQSYAASQPNRILSILVGLRDSYIYAQASGQFSDAAMQQNADRRWQSVAWAALISGVVILFGAVLNMIRDLARRRRQA